MSYSKPVSANVFTILFLVLLEYQYRERIKQKSREPLEDTPSLAKRESQNMIYNTGGDFKVYPTATEDCIKFDVPAGVKSKRDSTMEVFVTLVADVVCTSVGFLVNQCTLSQAKSNVADCQLRGQHSQPDIIQDGYLHNQEDGTHFQGRFYGAQLDPKYGVTVTWRWTVQKKSHSIMHKR